MKKLFLLLFIVFPIILHGQVRYPWAIKGDTLIVWMSYKSISAKTGRDTVIYVDSARGNKLPVAASFSGTVIATFDSASQHYSNQLLYAIYQRLIDSLRTWISLKESSDTTISKFAVRVLNSTSSSGSGTDTVHFMNFNRTGDTSLAGAGIRITSMPSLSVSTSTDSLTLKTNSSRYIGIVKHDTSGTSTVTIRSMPNITTTQDTTKGSFVRQWPQDTLNIRPKADTSKSAMGVKVINNITDSLTLKTNSSRYIGITKSDTSGTSTVTIRSMPSITTTQDTSKGSFVRQWPQDTLKVKTYGDTSKSSIGIKVINIPYVNQNGTWNVGLTDGSTSNLIRLKDGSGNPINSLGSSLSMQVAYWGNTTVASALTSRPSTNILAPAVRIACVDTQLAEIGVRISNLNNDSTKSLFGVKVQNAITLSGTITTLIDSIKNTNSLLRETLGYPGERQDSMRAFDITAAYSIETDSINWGTGSTWQRIVLNDTTKCRIITFLSPATGDSTCGIQIATMNLSSGFTGSNMNVKLNYPFLSGNIGMAMNLVNSWIYLPSGYGLYARRVVRNGALYNNYYEVLNLVWHCK
jgi:hypothetical protein